MEDVRINSSMSSRLLALYFDIIQMKQNFHQIEHFQRLLKILQTVKLMLTKISFIVMVIFNSC